LSGAERLRSGQTTSSAPSQLLAFVAAQKSEWMLSVTKDLLVIFEGIRRRHECGRGTLKRGATSPGKGHYFPSQCSGAVVSHGT
jgi:hypothetical protein